MDIHVTCWALSKAHAEAMLTALGIIKVEDGQWQPLVDACIAPCSVPYLTGNTNEDGTPEQLLRDGFHFDIIYRGQTALNLMKPQPTETDEEGNEVTLPWPSEADLFDRTYLLEMAEVRGAVPQWVQTRQPVPPGYEANGVRMFDPDLISSRSHGWA